MNLTLERNVLVSHWHLTLCVIFTCHGYESRSGFYLSYLQKHPLTIQTETIVLDALKKLLVYLWIRLGVYQSHTDSDTDSIIWPLMLLLMIFLLNMSVLRCFLLFSQLSWQLQMRTVHAGLWKANLILIKM